MESPVRRLVTTMAVFALAAGVNTASVWAERRCRLLSRLFGKRAFAAHVALISPPWAVAVAMIASTGGSTRLRLPHPLRPLGWCLCALAAVVWVDAFRRMGPRRTANGDFFDRDAPEPVLTGVYRLLRNPMYDAYALGLAAAALATGSPAYLPLAAESFLLLNLVEARIERPDAGGTGGAG